MKVLPGPCRIIHPVGDAGVEEKLWETPHSVEMLFPPRAWW